MKVFERLRSILVFVFYVGASSGGSALAQGGSANGEIVCQPPQVCRIAATKLPLMALPRPFSNLYKSQSASPDQIMRENVNAFFPLYVFARPAGTASQTGAEPEGWYQVGTSVRSPVGWMQAKDVFEWKQALVVAYKHPGGRNKEDRRSPVLMFRDQGSLDAIVSAPNRSDQAQALYQRIGRKETPGELVAMEPESFVDISEKMYLLPILDFKPIDNFDEPALNLLLAAAVPGARARPGESSLAGRPSGLLTAGPLEELAAITVDIVFVIDMTASMGPNIDQTRRAVSDVARVLTRDAKIGERVRFGLVGYRDNVQMMPGLEFTTRNFTPELVNDTTFVEIVGRTSEARVSSNDYPEEVFAGVRQGTASAWRPNSLRFMIIVGDASGHPPGHLQNTTGDLDIPQLRELAHQEKITVFAIHLRDPQGAPDWPVAEAQFRALAINTGVEESLYFAVEQPRNPENYDKVVKEIAGRLLTLIDPAQRPLLGSLARGTAGNRQVPIAGAPASGGSQTDSDMGQRVTQAITASLITYLGKGGDPPRDVVGWAFDHDLVDVRKLALEVRALLSKQDVNNLIVALEKLLEAMQTSRFTEQGLFDSLQGIVATALKDRKDLNFDSAKDLSQTNLLPSWIASLPYKSAVLALNSEKFQAMTADEKAKLEQMVKSNLQYYRDTSNNAGLWIKLDDRDADVERVYPMPLYALP